MTSTFLEVRPEDGATLERPRSGHVPALDGVRGLAALVVMLHHFVQDMRLDTTADRWVHHTLRAGWAGVDLFFVLSGFLITGILLDTKSGPHYFRNFYARRSVRIFPLYYGALVLLLVVSPLVRGANTPYDGSDAPSQAWYWLYGVNWFVVVRHEYPPFAHFWSLAIEEQFYLFWPIVVLCVSRVSLVRVCVGCIVGALALRVGCMLYGLPSTTAYTSTITRVDTLATGALLAALSRGPQGLRPWLPAAKRTGLACFAAVAAIFAIQKGLFPSQLVVTVGLTVIALLFGSVVAHAASDPDSGTVSRVFSAAPLRFLGKLSYCLYVAHPFVMDWVSQWMHDDAFPSVAGSLLPGRIAYVVVCTAATIAVAWLSWHLYEKHWLKLKTYFE